MNVGKVKKERQKLAEQFITKSVIDRFELFSHDQESKTSSEKDSKAGSWASEKSLMLGIALLKGRVWSKLSRGKAGTGGFLGGGGDKFDMPDSGRGARHWVLRNAQTSGWRESPAERVAKAPEPEN